MPNAIPALDFEARPVPSAGQGLYAAATIFEIDGPARHLGGVNVRPYNCDEGFGTYSALMCDPAEPAIKAALRALPGETFEPVVVWAADECATDSTEDEVQARAIHTRTLKEPLLVESAFATRLLADAGAPTVVSSLAEGLGVLEEFLGEQGYAGYIHAARRWAGPLSEYRWTNQTGAVLRSPGGHGYVFGGGYADTLGTTLIATGPLYVWRTEPFNQVVTTGSSPVPEHNNSVYGLSERIVVAGYECAILAVTITP
ncbi:hypothetical protein [Nocardia salmonicida]|uniref:hypothetical protein n=1 Tax=Nocardia salmonicida TaxID=53431 RepID=UPI0033F09AA2